MIIRNSIYNMIGLGLPVIVAIVAIPELIRSLGEERFGILTIIWAVVSYFGLFDLGLGRAVTQQVAASIAAEDDTRLRGIVGTSSALMLALGVIGGAVMLLAAPFMAHQFVGPGDQAEVTRAFQWMAVAMPAIVMTSGYRGILEATGRFGLINAIRLPMGIFTYGAPLAAVLTGHGGLDTIAAVLCVGRVAACGLHAVCAMQSVSARIGAGRFDRSLVGELLSLGGWISVSNIVSPIMSYVDRFVLGFVVSASAVAYYATPQELVLRIGIIPTAVAAVLFPLFASAGSARANAEQSDNLRRYSSLVFVLVAPIAGALGLLAHPLLSWWISPDFADHAAGALQVMSIAALCSGLAQVPFAMIQGRGRADWTAKLHLVELPVYLALLYVLVVQYGPIGAAWAWLIRIAADMAALYYICVRDLKADKRRQVTSERVARSHQEL